MDPVHVAKRHGGEVDVGLVAGRDRGGHVAGEVVLDNAGDGGHGEDGAHEEEAGPGGLGDGQVAAAGVGEAADGSEAAEPSPDCCWAFCKWIILANIHRRPFSVELSGMERLLCVLRTTQNFAFLLFNTKYRPDYSDLDRNETAYDVELS